MTVLLFLASLGLIAFAMDKDLEQMERKAPPDEPDAQLLNPKTKAELPWSISGPEILLLKTSFERANTSSEEVRKCNY